MTPAMQAAALALQFVMTLIAVWGVISATQRALKADLHKAIDDVRDTQMKNDSESRERFISINDNVSRLSGQIATIMEGYIHDLQRRVTRLESGQDDWTKELRARTHELGNSQQAMHVEIELLKKGVKLS